MVMAITANIRDTGLTDEPLPKSVAIQRRIEQVVRMMGANALAGGQEIETDLHDRIWDASMKAKGFVTYGQEEECPLSLLPSDWTKVSVKIITVHKGRKGDSPHRVVLEWHGTNLDDGLQYSVFVCHPIQKPSASAWHKEMHALYVSTLKERIAVSHDGGRTVVVLGDMNTTALPKLHPLAQTLAHSGLDYIVVVPAAGVTIKAGKPQIVARTEQMDHPILKSVFTATKSEVTVPTTEKARVAASLAEAEHQSKHGPQFGANQCKWRVRELYDVDSDGSATASIAWGRTKYKHPMPENLADIPEGALVWWTGGSPTREHPEGAGHVAEHIANGVVWSTDFPRVGFFNRAKIVDINRTWKKLTPVGWSEDIDGVRVIKRTGGVAQLPKPSVNKMDPKNYYLGAVGSHVTWLGQQLVAHGYGEFYKSGPGPTFTGSDKRAVAAFQIAQGWSGADADGLPGKTTLALLAGAVAKPKPPTHTAPVTRITWAADWSFDPMSDADLRALKAAGVTFVIRYIRTGSSKKVITHAEAVRIHDAGLGILLVWELGAQRAGAGEAAGRADAKAAEKIARGLGYPKGLPIFYAVDYDATAKSVQPYFHGLKAAAVDYEVAAYGGYKIVNAGFCRWNWQTVGWSRVNGVFKLSDRAQMLQKVGHVLAPKGVDGAWDENEVYESIPTWKRAS